MTKTAITQSHKQLLKQVTNKLIAQGYLMPTHCRLSYESHQVESTQKTHDVTDNQPIYQIYQGLTKAFYQQQWVMVKWQLAPPNFRQPTPLAIERANTKLLLSQQLPQKKAVTAVQPMLDCHFASVIPLICEHDSRMILNTVSDNISKGHDQSLWAYSSFTMPFMTLGSVQDYLKNKALDAQLLTYAQKHALIIAIAQSLENLHQAGWIHGDIKPSNILLGNSSSINLKGRAAKPVVNENKQAVTSQYTAWLIDLAYAQPITKKDRSLNKEIETPPRGTPAYLAPECWQGQAISVQSDIYAFGIMLYEIIVGKHPYQDSNKTAGNNVANNVANDAIPNKSTDKLRAWATAHCQTAIEPVADRRLQDLQPIIDKLLAKNRINRYQTVSAVLQDLRAVDALKKQQGCSNNRQ